MRCDAMRNGTALTLLKDCGLLGHLHLGSRRHVENRSVRIGVGVDDEKDDEKSDDDTHVLVLKKAPLRPFSFFDKIHTERERDGTC